MEKDEAHVPWYRRPYRRPLSVARHTKRLIVAFLLTAFFLLLQLQGYGVSVEQVTDLPSRFRYGKFNANEIASLMTEWYELLQEMHYLGSGAIGYAPRTGKHAFNVTRARELGIDERVIDLAQRMPYIIEDWAQPENGTRIDDEELRELHRDDPNWWLGHQEEHMIWGEARFMDFADLDLIRDPMYMNWGRDDSEEIDDYMLRTAVSVTQMGNHGPVFILDTRRNIITCEDAEGSGLCDPAFRGLPYPDPPRGVPEGHFLEYYPARSAPVLLRDFIHKLRTLEELPGGKDKENVWYNSIRRLYETHGWPDNFNGQAFDAAFLEWEENEKWAEFDREYKEHQTPAQKEQEDNQTDFWEWLEGYKATHDVELYGLDVDDYVRELRKYNEEHGTHILEPKMPEITNTENNNNNQGNEDKEVKGDGDQDDMYSK
ncbi:hypothetical protein UCRPC4_g04188 [Phaeomoniella chlamydospora]|uniref:Uncharacterized protein n=1 Tax=Phaeomoniella chlamydospora TaxID=158046 RepID=A0A0G2G9F5_PHACM|nr:hypothetical protein UCRPC4_g04188 [Phaeomoniella chlamydospora]